MRRAVVRHGPLDPTDNKRTLYLLECGHSASRRTEHWKKHVDCLECDRVAEAWRKRVNMEDNSNVGRATQAESW